MLLILSWLTAICAIEVSAQNFYRISSHYWNGDRTRDIPLPVDISLLDSNTQILQCAMQLSKKWKLGGNECAVFQRKAGMPQCFIGTLAVHYCQNLRILSDLTYDDVQVWVTSLVRESNCTVIQRRVSNSISFYRNWTQYATGFGEGPGGNYWIGLETIYAMTSVTPRRLYVEMTMWNESTFWASYSSFQIGPASEYYRMTASIGTFQRSTPTLGDCMAGCRGKNFSTIDADFDTSSGSCSALYKGGWWYSACHSTNPNGLYFNPPVALNATPYAVGIVWSQPFGYFYSMKEFKMMLW